MSYERSRVLLSRAMMPLLIIQFLTGTYVSLFTVFPASSSTVNPLEQIFTNGLLLLAAHVVLGFIILLIGIALLALGAFLRQRLSLLLASFGLVAILISILTGMAFVLGGYSDNTLSYLMSVGFIFSIAIYGAIAGTANTSLGFGKGGNSDS